MGRDAQWWPEGNAEFREGTVCVCECVFISYREGISTKEEIETPRKRCIINMSRILTGREEMVPGDGGALSQRDTFVLFILFYFCEPRETRKFPLRKGRE